jgi:hypothetical protein
MLSKCIRRKLTTCNWAYVAFLSLHADACGGFAANAYGLVVNMTIGQFQRVCEGLRHPDKQVFVVGS